MTGRSSRRRSSRQPARVDVPLPVMDGEPLLALATGLQDSTVGLGLADGQDLIRYVNLAYRASFFPH